MGFAFAIFKRKLAVIPDIGFLHAVRMIDHEEKRQQKDRHRNDGINMHTSDRYQIFFDQVHRWAIWQYQYRDVADKQLKR